MSKMRWYDIRDSRDRWRVFNMFLGGRGIGKTYSAIDYAISSGEQLLYVRSTERQIKLSLSPDRGNPFKRWAADHGRTIYIRGGEDINDIIEEVVVTIENEEGEPEEKKEEHLLGYAAALSTFENLRGVDFSQIGIILYDEFIQAQPFRFDAFRSFLNLYESVNRNRELTGGDPVRVIFLANTQELQNPILAGFDLVGSIEQMQRTGQRRFSRGDLYVELCDSEISKRKETSVLYRNLPEDDAYKREALQNEFSRNDFTGIGRPKNLREFRPLVNIDDLGIMVHKSRRLYYVSAAQSNKVPAFNSKTGRGLFYRHYGGALSDAYAAGSLICDSFLSRQHLLSVLNLI